jgi:hypothetical protein
MIKTYVPPLKDYNIKDRKIGIYVAQKGKSIKSQNRSDYMFTPDRPSASKKKYLQLSVTTTSDTPTPGVINAIRTVTNEYKHSFGYIPEIIVFVTTGASREGSPAVFDSGNTYINVPSSWYSNDDIIGAQSVETFDAWADEENVYVSASRYSFVPAFIGANIAATYNFDILLLMEEAK